MQGMKKEIIVIDYGTSNVRVNMIDTATGDIVHSASQKYAMEDKGMGYAEISTNDLWMHSVSCMKKVMDSLGVDEEYVALSFSFFGDNLIPVDCDGNALNDCILCMDARGEQEMCEINESIPKEQQIDEIGDWYSMPYKYGTKVAWIKKHGARNQGEIAGYDSLQQFIFRRLNLSPVNDYTMAVRKQIRNLTSLKWSQPFMKTLGLTEEEVGSEIVPSDTIVGYINHYGNVEFNKEIPVIAGGHDCDMALIGMGLIHEDMDIIGDVIGTFDHVGYSAEHMINIKKEQPETELCSSHGALKYLMSILGAFPTAGATLEWFMRVIHGSAESVDYQYYWDHVNFDGKGNVFVCPTFDAGRGKIEGLGMTSTKSDIFKGIIEALTFENRKLIDMCEKSKGQKVNSVRVCGGGAVSDEWMQLRADISGRNIERMKNIQCSSLGSAVLAAVKVGIYKNLDEAVEHMVCVKDIFEPQNKEKSRYEEKYERYIKKMGYTKL